MGEISDDNLRGIEQSLAIALLRAREAVMNRFRPLLAVHDLTDQQWRVLRVLAEAAPLDATELAERSVILTPSLTRILRALEARGLIYRSKAERDNRRWVIALSAQGRQVFEAISPHSEQAYRDIERDLGQQNLQALLKLLRQVSTEGR